MIITLDIQFEDCKIAGMEDLKGSINGTVKFDEFGIIKINSVTSSSFGTDEEGKVKAKRMLSETAERVRADLIRK
jgi:hypothetical protein